MTIQETGLVRVINCNDIHYGQTGVVFATDLDMYDTVYQVEFGDGSVQWYFEEELVHGWVAVKRGIYIMPVPMGNLSQNPNWPNIDIGIWDIRQDAIDAVQAYADEHNLIRCYVTPELQRASVKRWERHNGRPAPDFPIDK